MLTATSEGYHYSRHWHIAHTIHRVGYRTQTLVLEPEVFETRTVVNAVDHLGQPLHPRLPAGGLTGIEDDRADIVLGQLPFDLPHQLPALLPVRLDRLQVDQLVQLR